MGSKNQTSVSTRTPPSWVNDAYKNIFTTANNIAQTPYTPYAGGYNADQQAAFKNIAGLWGASDPTFQQANSAVTSAMAPTWSTYSNYMNPYVDDVVKKTMAGLNEQNGQQQQQVVGNAISKGAWGGDRVGVAQSELARQQALANGQTISGLYSDAFQQAMQQAQAQQQTGLQGASALANIGQTQMNTNLAQTAAQLGAGTQQQQFDYSQYLNKQGYPYQQASWLSSLYGGIGPLAGGTTTSVTPNGNLLSQLLGAGLGIAGLFADGGVVPYRASKDNPWSAFAADGLPYSSANSTFGSYVPIVGGGSHSDPFPDEAKAPEDNSSDPFSNPSSLMKTGASNIASWMGFADGGQVHFSDLGRPESTNIEDRRDWANGDDPLGDLIRDLNAPKKRRFAAPFLPNISDFDPYAPVPEEQQDHFADQYASGGVIPRRLASGGVPASFQMSPGYTPKDFYTGAMQPPTASNGNLYRNPVPAGSTGSPARGMTGSVIGNGTLYDAQNDPRYPVSPGFIPGTWANPNTPTNWTTASTDPASYYAGIPQPSPTAPAVHAIDNATSGVLPPRPDPRGYLTFNGPSNVPTGGNAATAWGGTPAPGYGGAPGTQPSAPAGSRPPGILGRLFGLTGGNSPMDRIFGMNGGSGLFSGLGSMFNGSTALSGPHASDLTGAVPKVPYHSKPITHDFAPVKAAGQRYDVMGRDMAFMPESVQTSSRWNTGYANGGVIPHLATGGVPFNSVWPDSLPSSQAEIADFIAQKKAEDERNAAAKAAALASSPTTVAADQGVHPDDVGAYAAQPVPPGDYGTQPGVVPTPGTYDSRGQNPFASGQQFVTEGDPRYSQNIGDAFQSLMQGKGLNLDPAARMGVLGAAAGMMAGKSPWFLANVGSGIQNGINVYNDRQKQMESDAKTRADVATTANATIPQGQANVGLTTATTGATRFGITRTQAGVMVTDALNPGAPPRFVPWGGILPDGTTVDPNKVPNGPSASGTVPLFSTDPVRVFDPRLMNDQSAAGANAEALQALTEARTEHQGARTSNQIFEEMKTDIDRLPKDGGLLTQGSGFNTRLGLARGINTGLQALGLSPAIPEDQVAAGEDLNKLTFRLGGELSKGIGSAGAASIIMDSVSAVPSGIQSKEGADRIIAGLEAMNQRKIDYYTALQKWEAMNAGSAYGFDQYFNSMNPPELYALSAYVPRAAMDYLLQHPEMASDFNAKYGNGRNVAQYVLRR